MQNKNDLKLTIIHPGYGNGKLLWEIKLESNITNINVLRKVLRSWAYIKKVELDEIELQFKEIKIKYTSIQTKRGLAKKIISFQEIFERGGKIFD